MFENRSPVVDIDIEQGKLKTYLNLTTFLRLNYIYNFTYELAVIS
jgi:hypothetical protein